jgi:hypothetical protein
LLFLNGNMDKWLCTDLQELSLLIESSKYLFFIFRYFKKGEQLSASQILNAANKMKGVLLGKVNGTFEVVNTLEEPKPDKDQVLVKSLVTAINPV